MLHKQTNYHHGQTIRTYLARKGWSIKRLAELWPAVDFDQRTMVGVDPRYVRRVLKGEKGIDSPAILRKLSQILDIPLWEFGLADYDPFDPLARLGPSPSFTPESLDMFDLLIEQTWGLRQLAPFPIVKRSGEKLQRLFCSMQETLSSSDGLQARFLRLAADFHCLQGVIAIDARCDRQAFTHYRAMYRIAVQLQAPDLEAHALMNLGVEMERRGGQRMNQFAVQALEQAQRYASMADPSWQALVASYLSRAYASRGDLYHFECANAEAQRLLMCADHSEEDRTFYSFSNILAELSNGYLSCREPEKVLGLREQVLSSIATDHNSRLDMWIPLDWSRAALQLGRLEESVHFAHLFLQRANLLHSPHALWRGRALLSEFERSDHGQESCIKSYKEAVAQLLLPLTK